MRSCLLFITVLCLGGLLSPVVAVADTGLETGTVVEDGAAVDGEAEVDSTVADGPIDAEKPDDEAAGKTEARKRDAATTERFRPAFGEKNTRLAILSSAVFPGLGQLYNEEGLRTLVVFVWEGYYLARILRDGYEANLYRRKARIMSDGELWRGLDRDGVRRRFVYYEERETDYIWYAAALLLASILDAYVFAQLHDFDTDGIRGVGRAGILPVIKPQVSAVGLQFRMQF